jgi:hypothetical protein
VFADCVLLVLNNEIKKRPSEDLYVAGRFLVNSDRWEGSPRSPDLRNGKERSRSIPLLRI